MRNSKILPLRAIGTIMITLLIFPMTSSADAKSSVDEGKDLSLKLCQTCHNYKDTEQAGTVGPPLVGMKARFPDRKKLYNIIYDPQVAIKKDTMMPPFGRNELVTKEEIEKIIDFLYTL